VPCIEVTTYNETLKDQVESFRYLSFLEGNDSLSYDKYDPDNLNGETWLVYVDHELAAISVAEASHYTGDPDIALRICRLHIAKKFRPAWLGMLAGEHQIKWAKEKGYKIVYITHDIHNRAINAMYQHKRYGAPITELQKEMNYLWHTDWYQSLKTDFNRLFRVDENSDFLQYVYYWTLEDGYVWLPKTNMINIEHDGNIAKKMSNKEILHGHA
tara:strand:- start:2086 stop:2727 length:642 start_codon:yes stop_codon:yes gene_type:complete